MVQYCCVPQCTKKQGRDIVSFHSFPNSKKLKKTWIHLLKIGKPVTKTMKVCSSHFSEDAYIKIEGITNYRAKLKECAIPTENLPKSSITSTKPNKALINAREKRKAARDHKKAIMEGTARKTIKTRLTDRSAAENPNTKKNFPEESIISDQEEQHDQDNRELQVNKLNEDILQYQKRCTELQTRLEQKDTALTELQKVVEDMEMQKKEYENMSNEAKQEMKKMKKLKATILIYKAKFSILQKSQCLLQKQILSIDNVKTNDKWVKYYTGITSYNIFKVLLNFLIPNGNALDCINYQNVSPNYLELEDQLFFVLVKLRHNFGYMDLEYRFARSASGLCKLFKSWINYLYLRLGSLCVWPHRDVLISNSPSDFREAFPNVMLIIDGTEMVVEKPADLRLQSQTYSNYKSNNTFKGLVGIDQRGGIIFVSQLMDGSISDREICKASGLLDVIKCKVEKKELLTTDQVMADKGFTISDILQTSGMDLVIPPFASSANQMSPANVIATKNIARYRVHVERAMKRIKNIIF